VPAVGGYGVCFAALACIAVLAVPLLAAAMRAARPRP
jgi:hypothetical protein